jgi:uncharacterized protein
MYSMKIDDKLVLVSGASSGIGAATAKAMVEAGGRVVLLARRKEALDRVVAEITSVGGQAWSYSVDLADADAVATVAKQIMEKLGTPDIIINDAGTGRWLFVDETSPVEAVEMMAVPYFATFNVTHAFLPVMLVRNSGHIVNVSSVGSRFVWPGATAYLAARWAVRGFTEALCADLDGSGIGVSLYESSVVTSPYWQHNLKSRERAPKVAELIPEITPEQAANEIVRGVQKNKRLILPLTMKLTYWLNAVFPGIVQWLMTKTGYRRTQVEK